MADSPNPSRRRPRVSERLSFLERIGPGIARSPASGLRPPIPGSRSWVPDMRVVDREREIVVRLVSPEIDPRKFTLRLSGRTLTVSGATVTERPGPHPYRSFRRAILLPADVDREGLVARADGHLLTIRIRKAFAPAGIGTPAAPAKHLRVRDLMTRSVRSVEPDTPVAEAAALLARHDIGSVPVCIGRKVVGILTDRDLALRLIARGLDASRVRVRDVMTPDPITCSPDLPLGDAEQAMGDAQVRRLPVVDPEGDLVGFLSMARIARSESGRRAGQLLRRVSRPGAPFLLRPTSGQ